MIRRTPRFKFQRWSLQSWMTSHVATGILALLCAALHAGMAPRTTVGGDAFWALAFLLVTGAIGRYFYAYVPRAANGRELELSEIKVRLGRLSEEWGSDAGFAERVRDEAFALIEEKRWKGSLIGRVFALFGVHFKLRKRLRELANEGMAQGVSADQVKETINLARRAFKTALMASHYEDLRAVLNTWRYLHRWVALLMVLLVILHIVFALQYSTLFGSGGGA